MSSNLPDGIEKLLLDRGEGYRKPKKGDEVEVHYISRLKEGEVQFDSSYDREQPLKFIVGKSPMTSGWDLALPTMLTGEKAEFTMTPEFAYGEEGLPPNVPPNATVEFEIELLSWKTKEDLFEDEGAIKTVNEEGTHAWRHPAMGGEVRVSVKVTSESGAVIDEKASVEYLLGSTAFGVLGNVVDKALVTMARGEKCSVECAKDYVYKGSDHGRVTIDLDLHAIYTVSDVSFLKDGTVEKKTVLDGEGYDIPQYGAGVVLKVEAATDGSGAPLPGFVGATDLTFDSMAGDVCDVLEAASKEMKKGERALVTCSVPSKACEAKLGLGEVKADKVIYTLELVDITKGEDVWSMSNENKFEFGVKRKDLGAKLFSAKRFEMALEQYKKVGDAVTSKDTFEDALKGKANELAKAAELNKALCFLKVGDASNAASCCNTVLKDDKGNVKALFRRAKARHELADYLDAISDLKKVLELEPRNAEARQQLQLTQKAQKEVDKKSKGMFAKMVQGLGTPEDDKPAAMEVDQAGADGAGEQRPPE